MQYGQEILDMLKYQTDLQFGLKAVPIDVSNTTAQIAPSNFFYFGVMADATANAIIDYAKDLNGNVILEGFSLLAGQRLDGVFTEIQLTSGRVYMQQAPQYNPYIKIKG